MECYFKTGGRGKLHHNIGKPSTRHSNIYLNSQLFDGGNTFFFLSLSFSPPLFIYLKLFHKPRDKSRYSALITFNSDY